MSVKTSSFAGFLLLSLAAFAAPQSVKLSDDAGFENVKLAFASQECFPKERVFVIGDEDFSSVRDMRVKFHLEGQGKDIYYLANGSNTIAPAITELHRNTRDEEWEQTYGIGKREDAFTLPQYKWLLLPRGVAIEFTIGDSSNRRGEHAIAIFVNKTPDHQNRVELISDTYIPDKCVLSRK